jgi:hypothetical protein
MIRITSGQELHHSSHRQKKRAKKLAPVFSNYSFKRYPVHHGHLLSIILPISSRLLKEPPGRG